MEPYKIIGTAISQNLSRHVAQKIFEQNKNSTCEDPSEFGSILTHTLLDKIKVRCGVR